MTSRAGAAAFYEHSFIPAKSLIPSLVMFDSEPVFLVEVVAIDGSKKNVKNVGPALGLLKTGAEPFGLRAAVKGDGAATADTEAARGSLFVADEGVEKAESSALGPGNIRADNIEGRHIGRPVCVRRGDFILGHGPLNKAACMRSRQVGTFAHLESGHSHLWCRCLDSLKGGVPTGDAAIIAVTCEDEREPRGTGIGEIRGGTEGEGRGTVGILWNGDSIANSAAVAATRNRVRVLWKRHIVQLWIGMNDGSSNGAEVKRR